MSYIDLTKAVDAAVRAVHADCGCEGEDIRRDAHAAVEAALPGIEAQVRATVAAEIEDYKRDWMGAPYRTALEDAARIARGTQ